MKVICVLFLSTDDTLICFQILTLFYGISHYFSEILTKVAVGRKICKCVYWNLRKKWWKMSRILTGFSNGESARFRYFFLQMIALQKPWKMLFILFKKLFSFSWYKFFFSSSPLFFPVTHCFRGWSTINLKVYDVINYLEILITHFV